VQLRGGTTSSVGYRESEFRAVNGGTPGNPARLVAEEQVKPNHSIVGGMRIIMVATVTCQVVDIAIVEIWRVLYEVRISGSTISIGSFLKRHCYLFGERRARKHHDDEERD
jgi:hypothetical protein